MDHTAPNPHSRIRLYTPSSPAGRQVKSVIRCLQIIEIFDSVRTDLKTSVISAILNIPISSTDYILKTMSELGYLEYNRSRRSYSLAHRVSLLGGWINPNFTNNGPIISLMREVASTLKTNTILMTINGLYSQVIHNINGTDDHPFVPVGRMASLLDTPAGYSLLGQLSDDKIRVLVSRYNAEASRGETLINLRSLMESVERTRRDRYAFSIGPEDGWVVTIPLPEIAQDQVFALGIGNFDDKPLDPHRVLKVVDRAMDKLVQLDP